VVAPGESLTSIAAADGLSVGQLAAANGLSSAAPLLAGNCLTIPPQGSSSVTSTATAAVTGDGDNDSDDAPAVSTPAPAPVVSGDGDNDSDDVGASGSTTTSTAPSGGSYVVQPGDTLSAVASRAGMSVNELAAANGLDPLAPLLIGTVLRLSGASSPASLPQSQQSASSTAMTQPVGAAAEGSAVSPPYPTPELVSSSEVGSIAEANGVPPALADAVAYQESGFNNGLVSTADARGVMQILPGTWNWIQQTLVPGASPLAPASASDNVRGGVLLLRSLLNATGGNPAMAAAGYYQGLPSVERNGMFPSTQQYVNDVLALEQRFSGGG
jgi:LysM repeat protein